MREPDQRVGVRVRAEPEEGMNSPWSQQDRAVVARESRLSPR